MNGLTADVLPSGSARMFGNQEIALTLFHFFSRVTPGNGRKNVARPCLVFLNRGSGVRISPGLRLFSFYFRMVGPDSASTGNIEEN